MTKLVRLAITLLLAALVLGVTVHAESSDKAQDVTIRFEVHAGQQQVRCGQTYAGIGRTRATITLQDFRIYVSHVRLLSADGKETPLELTPDSSFQSDKVVLLDFEDATGNCNGNSATHSVIRGRAPEGAYTGLALDIGVPVELNHQDTTLAAAPLNFSSLTWAWRYGYRFTTIDLETQPQPGAAKRRDSATGFSVHIGSVDCGEGSPKTAPEKPCATPNRPSYRLEAFDPAKQSVVFDLAALLAETDVTINDPDSASGCMSGAGDDDCVAIMDRIGLPFRGKTSARQKFVRSTGAN
jgi:uncharacterized repeat protein (TIGR04052 family)